MQLALAAKVMGVTITLSPGRTSNAVADKWRPEVALFTATAYLAPTYSAKAASNSLILGP